MAKWVCVKCGSSRVFVDARVAVNDRYKVVAYGGEYCEYCNTECEIKQVPCRTPEPTERRKTLRKETQ